MGVPSAPSPVVINEIDYDQPGTDAAEFIELYNASSSPVNLGTWTLELVNGNGDTVYKTITLPDVELVPGGFYVVCSNAATVENCDLDASPDTNLIQNGALDAVGLSDSGTLMDAVSYEGDTGAPYTEGPVRLASLPSIQHLDPLRLREHRHSNLLNKRQRLSPRVLRPPPETTGERHMGRLHGGEAGSAADLFGRRCPRAIRLLRLKCTTNESVPMCGRSRISKKATPSLEALGA
jgi:hypothetical protein